MFHRFVPAIALALALLAAACNKDTSTTGEAAQEAMSLYAKGFNALIKEPQGLIEEYFDKIPQAGPEAGSEPRLFPNQNFAASKIKEAREALTAAKGSAPATLASLAAPSEEALAAIDKVATVFTEAQKYYDAENYKDDSFAKGKELHAQMVEASRQFRTAIAKLSDGLSVVEDQQATTELAKYAADKSYSYWFRAYNIEAKKFLNAVEAASTPQQLAALGDAFKPVTAANDELAKLVAAKGTSVNATFSTYASFATTFHSTSTKILRLAKEGGSDTDAIGRELNLLVSNYNNLVNMAGQLYSLEASDILK